MKRLLCWVLSHNWSCWRMMFFKRYASNIYRRDCERCGKVQYE